MIFCTWVKCKDRLVNRVIDNDSAINFVAQKVIEKLHWPTEKLPKPYKVAWSNGFVVHVTHKCLASFKIGGYEDKIWCDVIPMNITHIPLGRPWFFDWEVQHDREKHIFLVERTSFPRSIATNNNISIYIITSNWAKRRNKKWLALTNKIKKRNI